MMRLLPILLLLASCTPPQTYIVPVSRATFAHRFPDTPTLARRRSGCLLYECSPRFVDFDLTPPRAYGTLP